MSSNIRIKRVCQHCTKVFTAKTTVTKFCSDQCAKANYKKRQKEHNIKVSHIETQEQLSEVKQQNKERVISAGFVVKELINISDLSAMTGLSERTIFRLMKDPAFPRLKIGKRLLFKKDGIMNYLTSKYGSI